MTSSNGAGARLFVGTRATHNWTHQGSRQARNDSKKSNAARLTVSRIRWPLSSARPRNLQNINFRGVTRFGLQSSVRDHRVEQGAAASSVYGAREQRAVVTMSSV
ncbi:hypothetical protein NL676_028009 [Syzygium grande]|nr:hypothetical protein NL676_028009 [Syzygium grande]